ncbi:hypothetical protein V1264_018957 [Littorina saxatilis]|uniref:Uncharacterized protein n=1 Tax=Littorina saxatilis TaxID=31220 RepID=A0AAN9BJB0_9CAEN
MPKIIFLEEMIFVFIFTVSNIDIALLGITQTTHRLTMFGNKLVKFVWVVEELLSLVCMETLGQDYHVTCSLPQCFYGKARTNMGKQCFLFHVKNPSYFWNLSL